MRSKIFALSKNEDFKILITKKKISNKYVTIFFGNLVNKNNRKLNISFVVKKKIGNAVKRNKIKRRLRNIVNEAVKKLSNRYVTIFFGNINKKNNQKLNISFVTKKKIGNAVKRNKIKRRLRNIMNDAVKEISLKYHYSYLVIAKSTMLNNEFKIIKETLFQDFKKIK